MPTASSLSINDGDAVAQTYSPFVVGPGRTVLGSDEAATSAGQSQIVLGMSRSNVSRPTDRITFRLNHPREQTVDGIVTVADVGRAHVDFIVPEGWTTADRDDLYDRFVSMVTNGVVTGYVKSLDPMY